MPCYPNEGAAAPWALLRPAGTAVDAGADGAGSSSDEANADRLRSLATLDHIDRDPLAFCQVADAGAVQSRCMHENIFAAPVTDDKAEPFVGGIEFHRADLLDCGLIGRQIRALGSRASRLLLQRRACIDTQHLGDLHALLARRDPNLKRGAWRHRAVAAALDYAHVKERVTAAR